MAWLWWLSGPVIAGTVASLWVWWTQRPARRPSTAGAVRAHGRFLESLTRTPSGTRRPGAD